MVRRSAEPSEGATLASSSRSSSSKLRSERSRYASIHPQQPSASRQATAATSPIPTGRIASSQRDERERSPRVSALMLATAFARRASTGLAAYASVEYSSSSDRETAAT